MSATMLIPLSAIIVDGSTQSCVAIDHELAGVHMSAPDHTRRQLSHGDVETQFRDFLREHDVEPASNVRIIADGKRHGYDIEGDPRGSKKAWYTLHADGVPNGRAGCQKLWGDDMRKWKADYRAAPMGAEERQRRDLESQRRKDADAKATRIKQDRAAARAVEIWNAASPAPADHPYLLRKRVRSHGLLVGPWVRWSRSTRSDEVVCADALLIPMQNMQGEIRNVQAIMPTKDILGGRDKDFLPGGQKNGLFFMMGTSIERDSTETVLIAEGYATSETVHRATGYCTYAAFDAGNLLHVAKLIRRAHPRACIVICADDDSHAPGNPGLTKAYAAAYAVGGKVAVPRAKE